MESKQQRVITMSKTCIHCVLCFIVWHANSLSVSFTVFPNSVNANQRSFVYTKEQGSIMFDKLQITGNATSVVTAAESGQKDV